jgi:DNA-directed RNA polymerase subunit F
MLCEEHEAFLELEFKESIEFHGKFQKNETESCKEFVEENSCELS